jgi:hypothetical protein
MSSPQIREESVKVCVLYEHATGRIVHVHHSITLVGGLSHDTSTIETIARGIHERHGGDPAQVRALHLGGDDLVRGARYKVDVHRRELVELPARRQPRALAVASGSRAE